MCDKILPFWGDKPVDRANSGFYGALVNNLRILDEIPRSALLAARILRTFSAAYHRLWRRLLRIWPDAALQAEQRGLIDVFLERVIAPTTHQQRLFFDDAWNWRNLFEIIS